MFNDPGKKIQAVAVGLFVVGAILDVIGSALALALVLESELIDPLLAFPLFLLCLVVAILLSWVTGLLIYGFGELIDKTSGINHLLQKENT